MIHVVFFFSSRRRHTRCSRDWSSDVCSSDLQTERRAAPLQEIPVPALAAVFRSRVNVLNTKGNRSEERRVGEECRYRGAPDHLKKKKQTHRDMIEYE